MLVLSLHLQESWSTFSMQGLNSQHPSEPIMKIPVPHFSLLPSVSSLSLPQSPICPDVGIVTSTVFTVVGST